MMKEVGYHILVVMDQDPVANLALINDLINQCSDLSRREITLMCCCPATYWEHGGKSNSAGIMALENELAQDVTRREQYLATANETFATATQLLQEAGAPVEKIFSRVCYEGGSLATAVFRELQAHYYSTVMVAKYHHDVINRLTKQGIWRLFSRHTPNVTVWTVDVTDTQSQPVS